MMIKKVIFMVSLLLVVAVLIPSAVHASVVTTITPSNADTTTKSDYPDTNYGGDTFIEPLHGYTVTIHWYGFVMFDLSSIPSGAIITSANLRLYDTEGNSYYGGPSAFPVYRVDESWNESTLTWNANPTIESTPTDSLTFGPSDTGYHSWNVTTDVQSSVSGAATNYGWCVQISADACWATFASKEGGGDTLPKLEITWTPNATAYIVHVGYTGNMFWGNVNLTDSTFSGWTVLPGETDLGVAAAVSDGKLYLVHVGMNNDMFWGSINLADSTFSGWNQILGKTSMSVAAAVSNGKLYIVHVGYTDNIFWGSVNLTDSTFSGWNMLAGMTSLSVSASISNGRLYIAHVGLTNNMFWGSVNLADSTFSGWNMLPGMTNLSPSIAAYDGELYVAHVGYTNNMFWGGVNLADSTFSGWNILPGMTTSSVSVSYWGELYIVHVGLTSNMFWGDVNLADSSFSGWNILPGMTSLSVAAAASDAAP